MAFVNGEWLARPERTEHLALLAELDTTYNEMAELTTHEIDQWEATVEDIERIDRIQRGEFDLLYFTYEYFSEDKNPGNPDNLIPAGVRYEDAAEFHQTLCSLLDDLTQGKVESNIGWSVGRRHAKTAYLSNAYLCHQAAYRHKKYIVEVSETTDVAGDFIQWARNQLVFNEKLRRDFGGILHERKSMNETDNKYEFITLTGTKVEAKGMGTQMRGLRHGATRPDLFLLDDLESGDNTNTKELRAKNLNWFRTEMLEALGFGGICVYMGTIVHYDSLLNHVLMKRKDFTSRKFPAILSWSEREDLWQEWRRLYNEDREDAKEQSDTFYADNEAEMLRGTSVLWPQAYTYRYFMEKREAIGTKAFNQEYLGNPIDEESQVFKPEDFVYYRDSDIQNVELQTFAGVDFAMGKERGDYCGIVTVGKSPNGIFYVLDVFLERVHPDILLNTAVEKTLGYQYDALAVEAQQAQEWFADKLGEALEKHGYPARTRMKHVKQRTRKSLRIEALLPDIQSGRIRFKREHRLLIEMFELYPNHNHDDGPDALEMAVRAGASSNVSVRTIARKMR